MKSSHIVVNGLLTVSVALVAILGDHLTNVAPVATIKALADNLTHLVIGALCWSIFCVYSKHTINISQWNVLEIISCAVLSSAIDVDHFVAAKSIFLKDATKLKTRPLLHCSSIPVVLFLTLVLFSYMLHNPLIKKWGLIVLTAFSTHHIRDGTRRGLWFYPIGNTPPLPYYLYIGLSCFIPYFMVILDGMIRNETERERDWYSYVV
ncbi:transmembrane protein 267 [Anthonomus grandis grandis]|uniref:transmembrane protein 267 n=1 Tax=Anthonomus grandis grandis TaxID=2921223 RepID=UPI002166BEFD|nr:transmembrane protein 267 [Anthonomus grandis grandis]